MAAKVLRDVPGSSSFCSGSIVFCVVLALRDHGGLCFVRRHSGGFEQCSSCRSVVSSSQVEGADGRGVLYRSAVMRFLLLIIVLVCANLIGLHLLAMAAGMFSAYVGGYIYIVKLTSQAADKERDLN